MNITVLGLWHLGCVTAACCARHFQVTGLDFDTPTVAGLREGRAPLMEPGLNELIQSGLKSGRLSFTDQPAEACPKADVLWVSYDTPVNDQDESDVAFVMERVRKAMKHLTPGALVLISSQLPAGSCRSLEKEFPGYHFACSPENLRLGKAIDAFEKADRVIVGTRDQVKVPLLQELFAPFTPKVLFMRTESAEMVKHALNSFLALSISYINEIARLCEPIGADAKEVAAGLKSEPRIGPKAYLGPGGPFAGGTLARDVVTLSRMGESRGEQLILIPAIKASNDIHRGWAFRRLQSRLGTLNGREIAVLGLTYTPNTSTLRRSAAVELCLQLLGAGAKVRAYDPAIKELPAELAAIRLCSNIPDAMAGAEAAVVCTEWPEFRQADWATLVRSLKQPVIVDANGFLDLKTVASVEHISVGRPI